MKPVPAITIENGIPLPGPRRRWLQVLQAMKSGQSFTVPDDDERCRVLRTAKYQSIKILTRKVHALGYRIWKL